MRPGLSDFLIELSEWYELVLFTAATRQYADYFLGHIDPRGLFSNDKILSREHCSRVDGYAFDIKDLTRLGRDLATTIIVDNLSENFEKTTPDNGIQILDFEDNFAD